MNRFQEKSFDYTRSFFLGSHTCSFALDLPAYSTIEIMCERLNYAISYCSSIDGDGVINDPPMLSQLHEIDSDFDANET